MQAVQAPDVPDQVHHGVGVGLAPRGPGADEAQVVVTKIMPMNNSTQITDAERALIAKWFEGGAKTQ